MLRAGVFGLGALGRHHTRILGDLAGVERVGVFDTREETARAVAAEFGARLFPSFEALAGEIDVAVLATPTVSHAELGVELLRSRHPPAGREADRGQPRGGGPADRSRRRERPGARRSGTSSSTIRRWRRCSPRAGGPRFVEVERLGVFSPRSLDVDVILDLMIHDLQILHALDSSPVAEVRATGIAVLSERIDIANARIALESGLVANLTASRVSAEKTRKLRAFYSDRYASLDYQAQELKGFRLDRSNGERRILPDVRPVERAEPLRRELECFVAACRGEVHRGVGGAEARRALATALEVARRGGRRGRAVLGSAGPGRSRRGPDSQRRHPGSFGGVR